MKLWIFLSLLASTLYAQEFRATLTGRVVDPSDAPIPGVEIVVRNLGTNIAQQARTDANGNYTILYLPPGDYAVSAAAPGFQSITRSDLHLTVSQTAAMDFKLSLGVVSHEVIVTADVPLLDPSSADRGSIIDEESVKEYPLNARNPFMLSMLAAGVDFNGTLAYQRPFDNGSIADWSINGSGNRNNEFLLDGAPNNAQAGGNNLAYVPPVDAVQEFKIQTNSYDAQYGRTGGGIVNVVLKSGTNRLHGSIYEFARRNALDTNSFQNNARGAPKDGHYLDQYGVQLDGPVYIPKLYNGVNKTFFLFNYEGYREGSPQPLVLSVPEPEMRNGDFSKLVDPQNRQITIYDPLTGRNVNGRWTRNPFPNNVIPANRINPIARRLVDFYPMPNTKTVGVNYSQQNYFVSGGMNPATDRFYNLAFKFDQNFGSRHHLFFRLGSNDRTEWRSANGIFDQPGAEGPLPLKRVNGAYVADWVSTLSPRTIINLRLSFSRYIESSSGVANRNFDLTQLGFPSSLTAQLPHGSWFGRYQLDEYLSLGRYPTRNVTNTIAFHPTVTSSHGNKTVKGGIDLRWTQYAVQNTGNVFQLNENKVFTQQDYNRADALSGNSMAGWLLGTPSSGTVNYNTHFLYLYHYMAPWVQYDWRLTTKLTMNFGLRLDFNFPPNERFNGLNRGFDTEIVSPLDAQVDHSAFPDLPNPLRGGLRFAGVDGVSRYAADLHWKTWQPRFGAAYALTRKTVIRGGWGRFYTNPSNDFQQSYGFNVSTTLTASTDANRTPIANKINDPFPTINKPPGAADGLLTYAGRGFNFVNGRFRIPYVDLFSFGIQRAINSRSRLEISYSGSRGYDQQTTKPFNDVEDGTFRDKCNYMLGGDPSYCDAGLTNPWKGLAAFQGTTWYTANTVSRNQLLRPFPQFGAITEYMRNDGRSWYNSLQAIFNMRTRNGVNLNVNYTFAKNIQRSGFLDPVYDVMQQGVYAWDKPHRFVSSMIAQLPFGRGKRFLSGVTGWRDRLVSGWEATFIFSVSSGRPWDLPSNVMILKDARLPLDWSQEKIRAVMPCVNRWNEDNTITMMQFSKDYGCTEAYWLIVPRYNPRYTPYVEPRIRLQTTQNADVSINKMTALTERLRLQFRVEAFNITNSFFITRAQFNNNPENANFGVLYKSTVSAPNSNYPRQLQLGIKLLW